MEIPPAGEQEGVGMKKLWSEVRALGRFLRSRIFAVSMLSLVLAFVVYQITTTTNTVYVIGEDGRTVSHTMENRPDRILQSVGLAPWRPAIRGWGRSRDTTSRWTRRNPSASPSPRTARRRNTRWTAEQPSRSCSTTTASNTTATTCWTRPPKNRSRMGRGRPPEGGI